MLHKFKFDLFISSSSCSRADENDRPQTSSTDFFFFLMRKMSPYKIVVGTHLNIHNNIYENMCAANTGQWWCFFFSSFDAIECRLILTRHIRQLTLQSGYGQRCCACQARLRKAILQHISISGYWYYSAINVRSSVALYGNINNFECTVWRAKIHMYNLWI